MLDIRKANESDYPLVIDFYYEIIDAMQDAQYSPGWKRDIYPSREDLIGFIGRGELYIGSIDNTPVSCMVLNHECNEGYKEIQWSAQAANSEILFIHILCVSPAYRGRGIAKEMVRYAANLARAHGMKAIRLDVLYGNLPAVKAYTAMGFQYRGTVRMYYDDTGWTDYEAYEFRIDESEL